MSGNNIGTNRAECELSEIALVYKASLAQDNKLLLILLIFYTEGQQINNQFYLHKCMGRSQDFLMGYAHREIDYSSQARSWHCAGLCMSHPLERMEVSL